MTNETPQHPPAGTQNLVAEAIESVRTMRRLLTDSQRNPDQLPTPVWERTHALIQDALTKAETRLHELGGHQ